ncbi:ribosome recycling factor domain-containing protein [Achaetomium macrosporum]|uniref:Ribosome recycling factor domain-containing protein n=1 Tax=Achaetomium macrosporum TaxID=79813 RepID=A0AAN7CD23_9PEZI|nr:ribosome recycling factor domain-containing protein [Achaetomium macrosporum]
MRCLRATGSLLRSNAAASKALSCRTTPSLVHKPTPVRCQPTPAFYTVSHSQMPWNPSISRPFSSTSRCLKKKARGSNNGNNNNQPSTTADDATDAERPNANAEPELDPYDFSDLIQAFERAEERYTEELKKLRSGGRFNADAIGAIPVQPDKKNPSQTFPLRELATVAPLGGRRWSILAFEEGSVKPIMSAVQRSDEFNQQPQPSKDNPLELTMTVEPERADALAKRAKDICQAWRTRVRDEAHRRTEAHKKWRDERVILSDDFHKLKKELQKLQDERMKAILAKEKEVVQQIMVRAS